MSIEIREAELSDLASLSTLFDEYRQFYKQEPNEAGARSFLQERLSHKDSIIYLALDVNTPVGFVQLYPSFSSVAMRRIFILNDLFVSPAARKKGIATALIRKSEVFASDAGAVRLELATEKTNTSAQDLYNKLVWAVDDVFIHYNKAMKA